MSDQTTDAPADPVHAFISQAVSENPIVLFMKGNAEQPMCGFSAQVVQILDHLGADYATVNVLASEELRQGIKTYADWPTIPQLYVKGEFVGGADIVREMFEQEELVPFLEQHGVTLEPAA